MNLEKDSLLSKSNSRSLTANNQLIDCVDSFSSPTFPKATKARAIPMFFESLIDSGSHIKAFTAGAKP